MMVRIRDPLHGTVELTALEEKLIDAPQMQRLRGVRQLAMAYLVYPGANHTRFEHSIGTLALAGRICSEMGLDRDKAAAVRAAALLHDIGHAAFSHESEIVVAPMAGDHEKVGERLIIEGHVADVLSENFSPKKIASLWHSPLGGIISSDVGSDRMDYLLRDSHYTGVAYGVVDADRICACLLLGKRGIVLKESGLEAAESLLVARFSMFSTVYLHKTVRIASRMLQQSLSLALDAGELTPADVLFGCDALVLSRLERSKMGGSFAKRLSLRHLFKKAYSLPISKVRMDPKKLEEALSEKCKCAVLVDVPRLSLGTSIFVETESGPLPIRKVSALVASLERMQKSRLEVLVMCEAKDVRRVEIASKRLLG